MNTLPYTVAMVALVFAATIAELTGIARARDANFFLGVVFVVVNPVVYSIAGGPFYANAIGVAVGGASLYLWWRHRNDDDDGDRGKRLREWSRSKLEKIRRAARVPAVAE